MKILSTILLITFFIFICISLTKSLLTENFDNKIDDEREECTEQCNTEDKSNDLKEETISIPLKSLLNHPAIDTDKMLKEQIVRPININISYDVEKNITKCHDETSHSHILPGQTQYHPQSKTINKCSQNRGDYITGTVSNNVITLGHGSKTTLGSGPVRLDFTDEYTVPKREFINSDLYQQRGRHFGSTDNAKLPSDIFVDEDENSYTIMKDKYISFPQERYSTTDLANMNKY